MLPLLALLLAHTAVATLSLCSTQNTAAYKASTSLYMSNGLCHDTCSSAGYSVGVVSFQDCYCSNAVPADTVDLSECQAECPGYPSEKCAGSGVFGYIEISTPESTVGETTTQSTQSLVPASVVLDTPVTSSTQETEDSTTSTSLSTTSTSTSTSSSSPTSTSTSSSSSTSSSTTSTSSRSTLRSSSTSSSSTTSTSSSSSSSHTTHTSSTDSSSSGTSSQAIITSYITSMATITNAQTQMVTAQTTVVIVQTSSAATESTSPSDKSKSSFFDDKAKVAGVFTVVGIVSVGVVSALIFFCCRFCCAGGSGVSGDDESEWDVENQHEVKDPFQVETTYAHSNSEDETVIGDKTPRIPSMHKRQVSLVSADFGTPIIDKNGESSYVDQRLDVGRFEEELEEVASLNDGEDYSRRVLKVMNP